MPSGDKATTADTDPVATSIPLPDEEDWKLVSKVPRRKKRAVLYVGNLHNDQDESNLRQYISERCLSLGNVTAVIDRSSTQKKENMHMLMSH